MKKFLLTGLLCAGVLVANAQAKDGAIKTNPLGMAFGIVNLAYEMPLNEGSSLQLGAQYFSVDILGTTISGFGLQPEYRIYTNEALQGFYFGPVASYAGVTVEDGFNKGKLTAFGIGGQLGWNWLLGKSDSFVIDLGLGAIYNSGSVKVEEGSDTFDLGAFDGVGPIISFSIGYAW